MHTHISALTATVTALSVLVALGTIRLWAAQHPDNTVAQAFILIY